MAISLERAEALAEGLPNSGPVKVIEGAGHSANLADPLTVNSAIGEFLKLHA
jgi:pimeloyl-ACP methyl ester carboxylesterase